MPDFANFERSERGDLKGMEIFEITPIVLGGDPTDPENKTVLTRRQHIDACRYWNKVVKEMRDK